ncbi:MAG: protein-L-isoaspartate O-methyltransferase family protein [Bacteroidota bacterium]|jgi:protein-L-isoaspartate(D-aspartate) O-methyltransferase
MIDYAVQRTNMVDSQVRTADVTDRRIIRAMLAVPREVFAPGEAKATAYIDDHLMVGEGSASRFILAPRTFAKMVQLLELGEKDLVLDVGCATGYSTAVLARLAARVIGLEEDATIAERARKTLAELGVSNAEVRTGRLAAGLADAGPFDAICVNGGVAAPPEPLLDSLKDGGRLVAIRVENNVGKAMLWRRNGGVLDGRPMFDAAAPTLPGMGKTPGFVF